MSAFNGIAQPPLSGVNPGESVTISFTVNSGDYVDGVPGDTRGYVIDQSSFVMAFEGKVIQGLVNPFPGGQTPYSKYTVWQSLLIAPSSATSGLIFPRLGRIIIE